MNVQNIIQASAKVVTITELSKGNVYKRLDKSSYSEEKIKYGVVYDVLYNGEDAVIQGLEFEKSYNDLKTEIKTFAGDTDVKIFSSSPEELDIYLDDCVKYIEDNVESKRKSLMDEETKLKTVKNILENQIDRETLTSPKVTIGE